MNNMFVNKKIDYIKILPLIVYILMIIEGGVYYILPIFHYKYPVEYIYKAAIWYIILISFFVLIIMLMFIFYKKIIIKILYFTMTSLCFFVLLFCMLFIFIAGVNGYSITEKTENYLIVEYNPKEIGYFPKNLNEDMKNIKYGYFFEDSDAYAIEIYLEITVEDDETLYKYINDTLKNVGEEKLKLSSNPYLEGYKTYYLSDSYIYLNLISQHKNLYAYTSNFFSLTYSEENRTIIWNLSKIIGDVYSNDYESFYFKRFNINIYEEYEFEFK